MIEPARDHAIHLVVIRNPFDRRERDERTLTLAEPPSVEALVGEYLPAGSDLMISINGDLVPREAWAQRRLSRGDQLVAIPELHGGDDGMGSILSIALMIAAPGIGSAIAGSMGLGAATLGMGLSAGVWGSIVGAGVGLLGSMVIGSLSAPQKAQLPARSLQSYDASPSYAWNPVTTQEPGGVVVKAYGRVKLYGNIIAGYIENTGDNGREQTVHMLIDLGMGPYSSLSEFEINDQPLNYYHGVTLIERRGHLNQDVIPTFNDTRLNHSVGAKVVNGAPVTRDTVGSDFDALEIVITFPQGLWHANDAGGLDTVSVDYVIEISGDGGATWKYVVGTPTTVATVVSTGYWSEGAWFSAWEGDNGMVSSWYENSRGSSVPSDHIEGEVSPAIGFGSGYTWRWISTGTTTVYTTLANSTTTSGATQQPIRRTYRADNLARGSAYKVRVSNSSADHTDSRYGDDMYLAEINEVLYDDFQYPRTVLAAVKALGTDQISGGLKFSCMGDTSIVRVWNGSAWSSEFSRSPAWLTWDALTQPVFDNDLNVIRYDGRDPASMDLAWFYAWAQWCATLVPDGAGGTEPRCLFDGIFDTPTTAWEAALEIAASARATLFMRGTTVTGFYEHAQTTPAQLFTVGNTAVKSFKEIWLPMADRAQAIDVDFVNAAAGHQRDKVSVPRAGIIAVETVSERAGLAFRGVRRASQAWREGRFKVERNAALKRAASLGVDIDSLACTAGDLIWVQDDVTQWGVGGRIVSGTATTLALDKDVTLAVGKTYQVVLRLADDTICTRTITTPAGTVSSITVGSAFDGTPAPYDVWALGGIGAAVKEFVVSDLTRDGEQRAMLTLAEYNASLHTLDDGLPAVPTPDVSPALVPAVSNLRVEEVMERAGDGSILVHLDLYFDLTDAVKGVAYNGAAKIGESTGGKIRYANVTSGATYTLQVRPMTLLGLPGSVTNWLSITHTVVGKDALPADVASLTLEGNNLSWPGVADIDLAGYRIKFQYGANLEWGTANPMHAGLLTSAPYTLLIVPPGQVTIMIRAVDTSGNESASSAYVITNFGDPLVANVVESKDYKAAGFPGTIASASIVGGNLQATQSSPFYRSDASDFYGADGSPFYTTNYDGMEWVSSGWTPSLAAAGSNMTVAFTLTGDVIVLQYRPTGPLPFYGAALDFFYGADADPFYDAAPDWMAWPGSVVAENQEYQFRVATASGPDSGLLSAFTVSVDVPDKTLALNGVAIGSGGSRLTGAIGQFNVIENVQLTLQGGSSAVALEIADKDAATGPLINAKNSAGSGVAATIDALLQGY